MYIERDEEYEDEEKEEEEGGGEEEEEEEEGVREMKRLFKTMKMIDQAMTHSLT